MNMDRRTKLITRLVDNLHRISERLGMVPPRPTGGTAMSIKNLNPSSAKLSDACDRRWRYVAEPERRMIVAALKELLSGGAGPYARGRRATQRESMRADARHRRTARA